MQTNSTGGWAKNMRSRAEKKRVDVCAKKRAATTTNGKKNGKERIAALLPSKFIIDLIFKF